MLRKRKTIQMVEKIFIKKKILWYLAISIITSIILFWKCKYGYATLDEAFYPTIANRFLQGDRILCDEWNNSQLSALVIMPFLKLYKLATGGYEGVYLYLRYAYTVLKIVMTIGIYYGVKKFGEQKAVLTAFVFLIFSCHQLMVISYNSIGIAGIIGFIIFLINADDTKKGFINLIFSGISLSIAVLGIPYMAGMYILLIAAVILTGVIVKTESPIKKIYSIRSLIGITIGIILTVAVFILYVLSRVSIANVLDTIPYILNSDTAHEAKSLYQLTLAYVARIVLYRKSIYIIGSYGAMLAWVILYYVLGIKKHRFSYQLYLKGTGVLGIGLLLVYRFVAADEPNCFIFVPNVVAFLLWIFAEKNHRLNELFYCIWLPGVFCTYFEYLASNTGFSGISGFSIVAALGSIAIIIEIIEQYWQYKVSRTLLCTFGMIIICLLAYYRITYVFWEDGGIASLTNKIEYGVCKGLQVTDAEANTYYNILADTAEIRGLSSDNRVLYIGDKILWMSSEQRCGCYSPLAYSITVTRDILYKYYNEHPEMVAKAMYIQDGMGDESMINEIADHFGYEIKKGKAGWILGAADE